MANSTEVVKNFKASNRKIAGFDFNKMVSPFAKEVVDDMKMTGLFKDYKIVPYAGTGDIYMHSLLKFLNNLKYSAPTYGACYSAIRRHTFSGELKIVRKESDYRYEQLEDQEEQDFRNFVDQRIEFKGGVKEFARCLDSDYQDNGNYYIRLSIVETLGERKIVATVSHSEHTYILETKAGENEMFLITKELSLAHWQKEKPEVIAKFPMFSEDKNGNQSSIIHIKNGQSRYGRPESIAAYLSGYRQWQDRDYHNKIADKQFMAQVLFEFEEDDPKTDPVFDLGEALKEGFDSIPDKLQRKWSKASKDHESIMALTRPVGAAPVFIHEFNPKMNESFFKFSDEQSRRDILENCDWSERLLGNAVADGFSISSYVDELKTKEVGLLKERREKYEKGISMVLDFAVQLFQELRFEDLAFKFSSSIEVLNDEAMTSKDLFEKARAYSFAAESGLVTPVLSDEEKFRKWMGLDPADEFVLKDWEENQGVKKPMKANSGTSNTTQEDAEE